ncbi:MAG TPA: neocarzinostatin apoprotein domain-containing protein, partial [Acidimicrobiales bacterium]|nr:neocarzinostatin apoprotein domain-containing protein [Acidimicrobiales bacterium]
MRQRFHFRSAGARASLAFLSLGVLALIVPGVAASGASAASGPSLKISQTSGLSPGQTVSITGKGLTGDSGDSLAQCSPTATNSSECDLSTEVAITVSAKGVLAPVNLTLPGPGDGLCGTPALKTPALVCGIGLVANTSGPPFPVTTLATVSFPDYYLSLGDSYSVGYQPSPSPGGATFGYTGYVAKKEKLTLENFGCGGATTASMTTFTGVCGVTGYGPPAAFDPAPIPTGDSQETGADA